MTAPAEMSSCQASEVFSRIRQSLPRLRASMPRCDGARRSSTARSAAVVTWVLGWPGPRSSAAYRPVASGSTRSWPPPMLARSSARVAPAGTGWLEESVTAGSGDDSDSASGPTTATTSSRTPTVRSEPRPVPRPTRSRPMPMRARGMASRMVCTSEVTRVARVATVTARPAASTTRPVQ